MFSASAAQVGSGTLYVDDVFSTYLYTGNGSTQTITNGIDLAGKGGLVWVKARSAANGHVLQDTLRGAGTNTRLDSASTNPQTSGGLVSAFNVNGFTHNGADTGETFASWTFREAPKFFDVVTWTGNGGTTGRTITHALGAVPACILVKNTTSAEDWYVYHRSLGGGTNPYFLILNSTAAQDTGGGIWGDPAAWTSTTFTTSNGNSNLNVSGQTYVAYLFAHDTATDGIIQCGSFTTDGSGNATVTLGWEPQFIIAKCSGAAGENWRIYDTMRAWTAIGGDSLALYPNASTQEQNYNFGKIRADGFSAENCTASKSYIYIAIRRPNKPPTTGTQVYNAIARTGTGAVATVTGVGFAPDTGWITNRAGGFGTVGFDRLRGAGQYILQSSTDAEATNTSMQSSFDMDGVTVGANGYTNTSSVTYINWFLRRAPGVFDVVCYTGTGSAPTLNHNLGVVPELIINKARNIAGQNWFVYQPSASAAYGNLNLTNAFTGSASVSATSTTYVPISYASGVNFVSYLFATLPGISKVFSYTGNGSSQTINCGFTGGARFVLIKRTDSTGDWYVWDSARGIVAANDPHLSLNTTAAEVTTDDSVDTDSTGFIVNQVAATNVNVNAATYIGLAIA